MSKPYKGPWVFRSLLFAPGHNEALAEKAVHSATDAVVLDLEDAVPEPNKAEARTKIRKILTSGMYRKKPVFVRINPLDTGYTLLDLDAVSCEELNGFVYPMTATVTDITNFDAQLRLKEMMLGLPIGHFSLIVLIETPEGILNAQALSKASNRACALLFGCEDFLAEQQGRHNVNEMSLHTPRVQIALAARAAGLEAIDTPFVRVHDMDALRAFANYGRDIGMSGMCIMSPKQVDIVHEIYTPSPEDVAEAKTFVREAEIATQKGTGIVIVDGRFISPPTLKAAKKLLERHEAIENMKSQLL